MNRRIRPNYKDIMPAGGHFVGTVRLGSYGLWTGIGGYLNYRGGRNSPHAHSHHEVCLALNGAGWFDHDGQRYDLSAGDLFLAHPGITHEIISDKEQYLEICFISFAVTDSVTEVVDTEADNLVRHFERERSVLVHGAERLGFYFRALTGLRPYDDAGSYAESRMLVAGLISGIMNASVAGLRGAAPEKATRDFRVAMAFKYMDDNLTRPLSVPQLARQSFTSERTLRRLVKAACGHSVVKEFSKRRMAAAAYRLVSRPEVPVAEVAYRMGFPDTAQFCREFKAVMGQTPGGYRNGNAV